MIVVQVYTDPPEHLFQYDPWYIRDPEGALTPLHCDSHRTQGKKHLCSLTGYADCDQVAQLSGQLIYAHRHQLINQAQSGYYWRDLAGLRVQHKNGTQLGEIDFLYPGAGADLIVIKTLTGGQLIIPYLPETVLSVDLHTGLMVVVWEMDDDSFTTTD